LNADGRRIIGSQAIILEIGLPKFSLSKCLWGYVVLRSTTLPPTKYSHIYVENTGNNLSTGGAIDAAKNVRLAPRGTI
jgi:hypothetical protein